MKQDDYRSEKIGRSFEKSFDTEKPDYSAVTKTKEYILRKSVKTTRKKFAVKFSAIVACSLVVIMLGTMLFSQLSQLIKFGNASNSPVAENSAPDSMNEAAGNSEKDENVPPSNNDTISGTPLFTGYYTSADIGYLNVDYSKAESVTDLSFVGEDNGGIVIDNRKAEIINSVYHIYYFKQSRDTVAFVYVSVSYLNENGRIDAEYIIEVYHEARYISLKNYTSLGYYESLNGVEINAVTEYKDGEYCSNAYFKKEGDKYYLSVMSPSYGSFDDILRASV